MTESQPASLKIIAVANQKGGVGKTTTAVNLAASLAYAGFKTLLIDLDPQGNASSGLGIDRHSSSTIYDVLIGRKELQDCIQGTALEMLSVIPANPNLIGAEVELIHAISREKKLKAALKKIPQDYRFVVFDCPPSLGLLTINALTASHSILIPTQCEYYAMEGLGQLLNTYQIVREDLNQELEIEGVLLTMFDPRNKLTHEVVKEMKEHFPEKLFDARIPRNVKLSESPSFGKPVILYEPESRGCTAYLDLAREVLKRNNIECPTLDVSQQTAASSEEVVSEPQSIQLAQNQPAQEEVSSPSVEPEVQAIAPESVVESTTESLVSESSVSERTLVEPESVRAEFVATENAN